jgi:hypothetical protein
MEAAFECKFGAVRWRKGAKFVEKSRRTAHPKG